MDACVAMNKGRAADLCPFEPKISTKADGRKTVLRTSEDLINELTDAFMGGDSLPFDATWHRVDHIASQELGVNF